MKVYLAIVCTKEKESDKRYGYISEPFPVQAEDDSYAKHVAIGTAVARGGISAKRVEEGLATVLVLPFR